MSFDLPAILKRKGLRRKSITLAAIYPTQSQFFTLAGLIVQVPRLWHEEATGQILDVYERTLEQRRKRDGATRDTADEVGRAIQEAEQKTGALIIALTPQIRNFVVQEDAWHKDKFTASIRATTNVQVGTFLSPQGDTVQDFTQSIAALVRSIDDDTRAKIAGIAFRGLQEDTPRRELAKKITEATNLERARALRIAVDQTTKIAARLDQARQEEAGITEYEWLHSHKARPRPVHVARNGKIYRWAEPPADGPPGTQPFCGCKARAHIDLS